MTATMSDYRCANHADREAVLVCVRCTGWFCAECAKPIASYQAGAREGPKSCVKCDGVLKTFVKPLVPDSKRELAARVLSRDGTVMVALLSLPTLFSHLGGVFAILFTLIWLGVLGGYCLQVIDHVAAGARGLPFSPEVIGWGEVVAKASRGLLLFAIAFGPALGASAVAPDERLFQLAALLGGAAIAPASLLAGVITRNGLNQLWPVAWAQVIARAPRAYASLLPWIYGSLALWAAATLSSAWLFEPVAPIWSMLSPLLHTAAALWLACLFGGFMQREADSYGL
jgi:hypothetical protein